MNLSDFPFFFAPLGGLTRLRLSGAGRGGPLPLLDLLEKCPGLEELALDNSGVYIPPGIAADRCRDGDSLNTTFSGAAKLSFFFAFIEGKLS